MFGVWAFGIAPLSSLNPPLSLLAAPPLQHNADFPGQRDALRAQRTWAVPRPSFVVAGALEREGGRGREREGEREGESEGEKQTERERERQRENNENANIGIIRAFFLRLGELSL